MSTLRMLLAQTKMNFVWYLFRDGEMMFWALAMPIFFLVLFSFAFGFGNTTQASAFLVPGLIGAQVLTLGFFGVGVMLAQFREQKVLRRIYLTPLPPWVFFAALVLYRLTLLAFQSSILALAGSVFFHVHFTGNVLDMIAMLAIGALTFVSLGTLVGAVTKTAESANNLASVLTVPLAFLSDAYIPLDRFPSTVSAPLHLLPSTQFIDALRGVTTGGEPLAHFSLWIVVLLCWALGGMLLSARIFRWV
ncbi:ABC transporter permease [bacterium]|nr:MAG: ABC transporter permease [bacterium]